MTTSAVFTLFDDFESNVKAFSLAICAKDLLHPLTMLLVVCRGETLWPEHFHTLADMGATEIELFQYDALGREVFSANGARA